MHDNDGLIEIAKILQNINHGEFNISGKMYEGQIARVSVPFTNKYKFDFVKAGAYFIEKLKEAQQHRLKTTFTITVDIKADGTIYLMDNGYVEKIYKVEP